MSFALRLATGLALMLAPAAAFSATANVSQAVTAASAGPDELAELSRRIAELEYRLGNPDPVSSLWCDPDPACNACCPGWFFTGDYLNWQVQRNDLGFAILDPAGQGVPAAGQPLLSLDPGPHSGYRVGMGRRTSSGWEVGFRYTFLRAEDRQTFAPGGGQVLAVLSSPATGLTNADSVTASMDFDYDVFDLEAARAIEFGPSLSAVVGGGVKFGSIEHRLRAQYTGGAFVNGRVDVPTDVTAVGGRVGGTLYWNVNESASLFGGTAFSLCTADIDARRREVSAGATIVDATRSTDNIIPVTEVMLGVRCYFGGWSLAAGYEWTNWFNAVSNLEFTDNFNGGSIAASPSDLGLQGLVVSAGFTY